MMGLLPALNFSQGKHQEREKSEDLELKNNKTIEERKMGLLDNVIRKEKILVEVEECKSGNVNPGFL